MRMNNRWKPIFENHQNQTVIAITCELVEEWSFKMMLYVISSPLWPKLNCKLQLPMKYFG